MRVYARAAALLDRQQRPTVECPMCCAEVVRLAGAYDTPAPSAEPVNLNDPAVQKRLAAQWGYVPAPSVEPVAWIESPHGAIRANPLYRLDPPPQSLAWRIPLYTTPPDHREVMRQALDALTAMTEPQRVASESGRYKLTMSAISALRAALGEKR